jgi:hypothetical protein
MKKLLIIGLIIALKLSSIFSGCIESDAKGTLQLQITDKPGELEILYANVTISMVQVHKADALIEENDDEGYNNSDEYEDGLVAYANGSYQAEVNEDIQFLGDAEGGIQPYNWSWNFGDGSISYEQNPLHNYSSEGIFIVNLTITDEDGNGTMDWYITTAKIGVEEEDDSGEGWYTIVEESQTFDLIALQDVKEELGLKELSAGKYTQIRLTVENANISINNEGKIEELNLKIPSDKVKLIKAFWIYEDQTTILTLDFDIKESVHKTGNDNYIMKPTIKVIQE